VATDPQRPTGDRSDRRALAQEGREADHEFDVFISHASEDKADVVRPLADCVAARGVAVWYDEFELRLGDSLRRKIDSGIARSRESRHAQLPLGAYRRTPETREGCHGTTVAETVSV